LSDFTGFYYDSRHSSEFNIFRISNNPYYQEPLYGNIQDNYREVVGRSGGYFINTIHGVKSFSISLAFQDMTIKQFNDFKAWMFPSSTFKTLIWDESPWKECYCKVSQNPMIDYIPLGKQEIVGLVLTSVNNHVLSGMVTIQMLQTDPYSYATAQSVADFSSKGTYENIWYNNSNILLTAQTPATTISNVSTATYALIYNGGNKSVFPDVTITGTGTNIIVAREVSAGTFEGISIDAITAETLIVENDNGQIILDGTPDTLVTFRKNTSHKWLNLLPTVVIDRFTKATYNVGVAAAKELILPSGEVWPTSCVGKYVCLNNAWYKIASRESDTKVFLATSDSLVDDTEYLLPVLCVMNNILITGDAGFSINVSFTFKYSYI
jgi:hypothetical protein